MINDFLSLFQTDFYREVWRLISSTWPVWLPLILLRFIISTWITYKRREWLKKTGSILLEIKIPKNTDKSPAAMEMVIEGIWEDVIGSLTNAYFEGEVRDVFSLEIVSLGGEVKFFIWSFPKWKSIIESRIYTHYPGAEVVEVEDYAVKVIFNPETMNLWGITTRLVKPGENAWIQILIQGHRKEGFQDVRLFSKPDWREGIKKEIKKIIEEEPVIKPEKGKPASLFNITETQSETIKAIERNSAKLAFDSMLRVVYVASKEIYVRTRGVGIIGSMRQFGSKTLNGIRPHRFIPGIVYPWDDFLDIRRRYKQRTLLEAYKRRSAFNVPYRHVFGKPYVLTTEELATLFHVPGSTATTPTLTRVPSKKAEAPSNLPV